MNGEVSKKLKLLLCVCCYFKHITKIGHCLLNTHIAKEKTSITKNGNSWQLLYLLTILSCSITDAVPLLGSQKWPFEHLTGVLSKQTGC